MFLEKIPKYCFFSLLVCFLHLPSGPLGENVSRCDAYLIPFFLSAPYPSENFLRTLEFSERVIAKN